MKNSNFKDNSGQVRAAFASQVARGLTKCLVKAQGHSQDICPVDTGTLRRSITTKVVMEEYTGYLGTNVEYAVYVEIGTGSRNYPGGSPEGRYQHGAQPYLKPAIADHADEYRAILQAELQR